MPRYRFSWDNVDPGLRGALSGEEHLDPAVSTASLTRSFGSRPTVRLVAERWPVLRDRWLADDDESRREVVTRLRAAGRGDAGILLNDRGQEQAFLRSCRNNTTLRRIVLDVFVRAGERPGPEGKESAAGPTWAEVERSLARVLGSMGPGERLVLSVRGPHAGPGHTPRGLVLESRGADAPGLRAEAVSNSFLADADRLSAEDQARLVELGWQPPTHLPGAEAGDPGGSANYYLDRDAPVPVREVARTVVATLRGPLGARRPASVVHRALGADGTDVTVAELGLDHEDTPSNVSTRAAEDLLPTPASSEELRTRVEQALLPVLSGSEVIYDEDGDIPIAVGPTQVFVRCSQEVPLVRVFTILMVDPPAGPELLSAVNEVNQRFVLSRCFYDGRCVVLAVDVPATPFVAAHLLHAVGAIGGLVGEVLEELLGRLGEPATATGGADDGDDRRQGYL